MFQINAGQMGRAVHKAGEVVPSGNLLLQHAP